MEHRDPTTFTFNDEETELIKKHVESVRESVQDRGTNLKTDSVTVPNQNFAIISIVNNGNDNKSCIKIRGVFETIDDAKKHATRIASVDSLYNLLIVSMYDWLLIPPDYEKIQDQIYIDEQLNELITEYKVHQEKSKIEFELRKDCLKKNTHTVL